MTVSIAIGIFAHQEEKNICSIICEITKQSIIKYNGYRVEIYILANGCTDNTVVIAKDYIERNDLSDLCEVIVIDKAGKSNAWNMYVHDICNSRYEYILFCDADIRIPDISTIEKMTVAFDDNKNVCVINSKPIKDICYDVEPINFIEKIITQSAGGFSDWKSSICGQLYIVRASAIYNIYMPIGLPVEDGYIGAAIVTENFNKLADVNKIHGVESIWHVYESEKKIVPIIKHQVRIVVGSAINYALFTHFNQIGGNETNIAQMKSASDESWLPCLISSFYPKKWGWIPPHFLLKRLKNFDIQKTNANKVIYMFIGFVFDFIVYVKAQIVMIRDRGPGFW